MLSLLTVGLTGVLALVDPAAPLPSTTPTVSPAHYLLLNAPDRRVRAADARLQSLIAEGLNRSRTFASLVTAVNRTDVIVYIESGRVLPTSIVGRLLLAAGPEGTRYLRIQVSGHPRSNDMIALVGHELRHALEVAESPEVRDESGLIALYQRIGHPTSTGATHQYDTVAAQDTGRRVKAELKG